MKLQIKFHKNHFDGGSLDEVKGALLNKVGSKVYSRRRDIQNMFVPLLFDLSQNGK